MSYEAPAALIAHLFRRLACAPADGPALRCVLRAAAFVPLVLAGIALACAIASFQP